ncbi:hypothetical protein BFJ71_g15924 [Fusarium oxysporum]|nr:hypothetical protein BFJ71_g15924 [Fusarium oxysporum]
MRCDAMRSDAVRRLSEEQAMDYLGKASMDRSDVPYLPPTKFINQNL